MLRRETPNWIERGKWDEVRKIGLAAMEAAGSVRDDTADVWAQNFLYYALLKPRLREAKWPFSEFIRECIKKIAARFAESELQRVKRRRKKVSNYTELSGDGENAVPFDPVDTRPGPEDSAILLDMLSVALIELDNEKPLSRFAFWDHAANGTLFTDLEKETGESADNLRHGCARILKRLKEHCNGMDLTEEEIRDYLNQIDRHRHGLM